MRERITITFSDHPAKDFSTVYRFLVDKYRNNEKDCPAVVLLDNVTPMIIQDQEKAVCVLLDRNSERLIKDLKKIIRKCPTTFSDTQIGGVYSFWCPYYYYYDWYKWMLEICDYLQIDAPAIYISTTLISPFENLKGAVLPGGDVPYATDIFLRAEYDPLSVLKTLLHELRHVWQHKHHNEWFEGYFSFNPEKGNQYYLQKPEIDADAFAYWVLETNGAKTMLEDLGEERCGALRKYMESFSANNTPLLQLSSSSL